MYDAKNHINWEWADGIPYSEYNKFVFLAKGLGSRSKCFKTVLHISLSKTPIKKVIWKKVIDTWFTNFMEITKIFNSY